MIYDIRNYGAVGDGKTLNTAAVQKAIDDCASKNGGTVLLEDGIYMTGSIVLRSNVNLHIEQNAVLLGSPNKIRNIYFNDCRFECLSDEELPNFKQHGAASWDRSHGVPMFENVDNISFNNTNFSK